jgi:hypothetical protein
VSLDHATAARRGATAVVALAALLLPACGSAGSPRVTARPASATPPVSTAPAPPTAPEGEQPAVAASGPLAAAVQVAKRIYGNETHGPKLHAQTTRIAGDGILLEALARGDFRSAQAEAQAQLKRPQNHFEHVTRIAVLRGSREVVNATVNADGVFVVAGSRRTLTFHGRAVGTLLVSLQDVTGFVKLIHRHAGTEALARGSSGHIRTSLQAARLVTLPHAGRVTIAGRSYSVLSFHERAWRGEPLTVWVFK